MTLPDTNSDEDAVVFHIAENQDWNKPGESYQPSAFSSEGFVHLSSKSQVLTTAQRYYAGRTDLTLLTVKVSALPKALVYENLLGGEQLFPHYYAEIPRDCVVAKAPLLVDAEGGFSCTTLDAEL